MEEGPRGGGLLPERVDVCHDVVPEAPLVARRHGEVGVVEMRPHLSQRAVGDVEPELAFGLREGEPEPPPQRDAVRLTPQALHRRGGVSGAER